MSAADGAPVVQRSRNGNPGQGWYGQLPPQGRSNAGRRSLPGSPARELASLLGSEHVPCRRRTR
ncbi:hypothetical protein ACFH04_02225 [Streptomyces noboritoensis]|uniref:Uncharacterized protein n=1 Tax=Streptomyces noboritoensis TaxID=67337 RepID=A0ABV6TBD2_9ACTN